MCLILEVDQPFLFFTVYVYRNYNTAGIDLIRFFLISKLSFCFQFLLRMTKRQLTEMRSFIVQTAFMYARTKLRNLAYLFLYSLEQTASMTVHVHLSVLVQRWM